MSRARATSSPRRDDGVLSHALMRRSKKSARRTSIFSVVSATRQPQTQLFRCNDPLSAFERPLRRRLDPAPARKRTIAISKSLIEDGPLPRVVEKCHVGGETSVVVVELRRLPLSHAVKPNVGPVRAVGRSAPSARRPAATLKTHQEAKPCLSLSVRRAKPPSCEAPALSR